MKQKKDDSGRSRRNRPSLYEIFLILAILTIAKGQIDPQIVQVLLHLINR